MSAEENIQASHTYYKQLDGLRFIAIAGVLFGHWVMVSGPGHIAASSGVNLFFVLSGFLITRILIKNKLADESAESAHWFSIRQFYFRRFLRIFPIYYLLLFISCILNFEHCRDFLGWLLTYTCNIYWIHHWAQMGRFGHLWSLAVEEQFYFIFPFLILFTPRRFLLYLLYAVVLLSVLTRLYYSVCNPGGGEPYALMPCCLDSFGLGGILAHYIVFNKAALTQILNKHWIFITSLLLFLLCCLFPTHYFQNTIFNILSVTFSRFFLSICCFWVIGIATTKGFKGLIKILLENSVVVYIGKISYGVYLYHNFIPVLTMYLPWKIMVPALHLLHIAYPFNNFMAFLWFCSCTIFVATLSWYLIEKPINGLKKYFQYT